MTIKHALVEVGASLDALVAARADDLLLAMLAAGVSIEEAEAVLAEGRAAYSAWRAETLAVIRAELLAQVTEKTHSARVSLGEI
jgi:hypothetical protein